MLLTLNMVSATDNVTLPTTMVTTAPATLLSTTANSAMTTSPSSASETSPAKEPIAKRQFRLLKFETCIRDEDGLQKALYNAMLANKVGFESENMVYKSWLFLKLDAMGEDGESLKLHLESKMPKNLARTKKRKPGPDDPQGADKFNVCSDAWVNKHKKVQEKLDKKVQVKGQRGRGRKRKLEL